MSRVRKYVSLFSGIEAASQAWEPLGWEPLLFADIDQFPSAVLAHHYPEVPNVGNVEEVDWNEYRGQAELVVGGSPCQSFSVAGKRLGLDDPRGNLALEFLRAVREIQPTWFLFENVPGLLSSDEGRDFGIFLGQVAELGYGFAWRILDAQYFGVPQRRRRLFVVGHIGGDWRSAASVLFESESLQWNSEEGHSEGQSLADFTETGTPGESGSSPRGRIETTQHLHEPDNWMESSKSRRDLSPPLDARDAGSTGKPVLTEEVVGPRESVAVDVYNQSIDGDKAATLTEAAGGTNTSGPKIMEDVPPEETGIFRKSRRAQTSEDCETWVKDDVTNTLNAFDVGDVRTTQIIREPIAFEQNQRSEIRDLGDKSTSLKAQPGTNQQTFVAVDDQTVFNGIGNLETAKEDTTANAITARDSKDARTVVTEVSEPLHGDTSPTLDASYGKGCGERAGIERQVIGEVIGFSHTQGLDPQPSKENFPTLRAEGQGHAIGFDWKNTGQTNFSKEKTGAPLTAEGGLAVGVKQQLYENRASDGRINEVDTSPTLTARSGTGGGNLPLVSEDSNETNLHDVSSGKETDVSPTLVGDHNSRVADKTAIALEKTVSPTLTAHNLDSRSPQSAEGTAIVNKVLEAETPAVSEQQMAVRRLTPLECERLQGFPDHYTKIPYRGKEPDNCPDGPRYKALGNSMAVPVMRWIGEGIQLTDEILESLEERPDATEVVQKTIFDF